MVVHQYMLYVYFDILLQRHPILYHISRFSHSDKDMAVFRRGHVCTTYINSAIHVALTDKGRQGRLPVCQSLSLSISHPGLLPLADRWFTAMQYIATVTCSIAVATLAMAAFRPANVLAKAGSWLMFAYALCQAVAVVLGYFVVESYDELLGKRDIREPWNINRGYTAMSLTE